jgi:hypothetical protein
MTTVFTHRRLTGFGPLKFGVLWGSDGSGMPGWSQESFTSTVHIPGSDRNETFLLGSGPLTITYRLVLASVADYRELVSMKQTQDMLTLYTSMCELGGREVVHFGTTYTELDAVTLLDVGGVTVRVDGEVECDATFQLEARPE